MKRDMEVKVIGTFAGIVTTLRKDGPGRTYTEVTYPTQDNLSSQAAILPLVEGVNVGDGVQIEISIPWRPKGTPVKYSEESP